jgi:hypothetical protein
MDDHPQTNATENDDASAAWKPADTLPAGLTVREPAGGDSPCWAHLLDDDGRMPESLPGEGAAPKQ